MTRGEIYWADYGVPFGSETGFRRPVLIIQNDSFTNSGLNTVIVVPLSTNLLLADAPGNVFLDKNDVNLPKDSVALVAAAGSIDKRRISEKISKIPESDLKEIEDGLRLVMNL